MENKMNNVNNKKNFKLKEEYTYKTCKSSKKDIGYKSNKSKMLMSFDDYYDKNVSKEEKREIDFQVDLIEKLIKLRNSKKCTQRKLAEICNIKQPEIARIESFKCSPQVDTLIKLLVPLGYTLKIEAIAK